MSMRSRPREEGSPLTSYRNMRLRRVLKRSDVFLLLKRSPMPVPGTARASPPCEQLNAQVANFFCFMKWLVVQAYTSMSFRANAAYSTLRTSYPRPMQHSAILLLSLRVVQFLAGFVVVGGMDPGSHLHQVAGTSSAAARQAS